MKIDGDIAARNLAKGSGAKEKWHLEFPANQDAR